MQMVHVTLCEYEYVKPPLLIRMHKSITDVETILKREDVFWFNKAHITKMN